MLPPSFWDHVRRTTGCWLWVGSRNNRGYGHLTTRQTSRLAHRVSFEHHVRDLAPGEEVDHLCRERACVRPDHLEAVSRAENIRRATAAKTACANGHPYSADNPHRRRCRICDRNRYIARREESLST